jgi:hypothetical protein
MKYAGERLSIILTNQSELFFHPAFCIKSVEVFIVFVLFNLEDNLIYVVDRSR